MEQAVADCPACGERNPHQVLKTDGVATLKCGSCGHVHKKKTPSQRTVERRIIVSQGDESFSTHTPIDARQELRVGDEFVLETEDGVYGVEITSLEVEQEGDNARTETAPAKEVGTVWTRVIDNVTVPITLHTGEGEAENHELQVPGDYSFEVGETEEINEQTCEITAFVTRSGDRFRLEGDDVAAKNAKRIYAEQRT